MRELKIEIVENLDLERKLPYIARAIVQIGRAYGLEFVTPHTSMKTGGFSRSTEPPTPQNPYKMPHERPEFQERLRKEREKREVSMTTLTPEQRERELAKQREFTALACALMMREMEIETVDGVQQATVSFRVKE